MPADIEMAEAGHRERAELEAVEGSPAKACCSSLFALDIVSVRKMPKRKASPFGLIMTLGFFSSILVYASLTLHAQQTQLFTSTDVRPVGDAETFPVTFVCTCLWGCFVAFEQGECTWNVNLAWRTEHTPMVNQTDLNNPRLAARWVGPGTRHTFRLCRRSVLSESIILIGGEREIDVNLGISSIQVYTGQCTNPTTGEQDDIGLIERRVGGSQPLNSELHLTQSINTKLQNGRSLIMQTVRVTDDIRQQVSSTLTAISDAAINCNLVPAMFNISEASMVGFRNFGQYVRCVGISADSMIIEQTVSRTGTVYSVLGSVGGAAGLLLTVVRMFMLGLDRALGTCGRQDGLCMP